MAENADDIQSASYRIISFKGPDLPASYKPLLIAKWLRSLRTGNDYFKLIDNEAYYNTYDKFIKFILGKPSVTVRFAVLSDDHDVVLGFSVIEGDTLHYVHVHKDNRQLGIGRALLPEPFTTFTHITRHGMRLWPKFEKVKFNPFK